VYAQASFQLVNLEPFGSVFQQRTSKYGKQWHCKNVYTYC